MTVSDSVSPTTHPDHDSILEALERTRQQLQITASTDEPMTTERRKLLEHRLKDLKDLARNELELRQLAQDLRTQHPQSTLSDHPSTENISETSANDGGPITLRRQPHKLGVKISESTKISLRGNLPQWYQDLGCFVPVPGLYDSHS